MQERFYQDSQHNNVPNKQPGGELKQHLKNMSDEQLQRYLLTQQQQLRVLGIISPISLLIDIGVEAFGDAYDDERRPDSGKIVVTGTNLYAASIHFNREQIAPFTVSQHKQLLEHTAHLAKAIEEQRDRHHGEDDFPPAFFVQAEEIGV